MEDEASVVRMVGGISDRIVSSSGGVISWEENGGQGGWAKR